MSRPGCARAISGRHFRRSDRRTAPPPVALHFAPNEMARERPFREAVPEAETISLKGNTVIDAPRIKMATHDGDRQPPIGTKDAQELATA
jgi:UDP-N-acetylglucosamine 2-epimerase